VNEPDRQLELSPEQMTAWTEGALRRIVAHLETLPQQPSADLEGAESMARAMIEPLPQAGTSVEALFDWLFEHAIPKSFNTAGPGYLGYIPGGGLFHAALADLVADAANRFVGVWAAAPLLAQLEANVVRWFCEIVGYPPSARGVLTTGGSLANFSAIVTARRTQLPENFLNGTIYASEQTHHSVSKAAALAGFPPGNVRAVDTDAAFCLRPDALEAATARDRRDGRTPFLLVGNAGTTNTGAVDDLDALADLSARERLWLHVDGAYGGFFALTERGRARLKGIARADSVTLDPHKGLFLPYGMGSLLVRDGEALRRAHTVRADYMPEIQTDPDFWDFSEFSPELSRDFRGLRAWLPLKVHGAAPFRRNLDEKLDLARWAAETLRELEEIELVAEPQLSVLAFRLNPADRSEDELNALNRTFLERINARRRVFLTGTTLNGRFVVRVCVLSFRTHLEHLEMALEDARAAARECLAGAIPKKQE